MNLLPIQLLYLFPLWVITRLFIRFPQEDPDTWWHLRTGEWVWQHKALPHTDPFSWTAGSLPWFTHEWLYQTVLYPFSRLGVYGLLIFTGMGIVALHWLLVRLGERDSQGNKLVARIIAAICILAPFPFLVVHRPQIFSYVLFVLYYTVLSARRRLWLIPLFMVIWANIHGSFILGVAMVFFEWVLSFVSWDKGLLVHPRSTQHEQRRLGWTALFTTLTALINPHGVQIFTYAFWVATHREFQANIVEWLSPDFQTTYYKLSLAIPLLLILFVWVAYGRRIQLRTCLYTFGFLFITLTSRRYLPYLYCALTPFLAQLATGVQPYSLIPPSTRLRVVGGFTTVILVGLLWWPSPPSQLTLNPQQSSSYPAKAVAYMLSHPVPQPIFNEYKWGGYLIYTAYPQYKVFIDGRADIFGQSSIFRDYLTISRVEADTINLLNRYGVRSVLMPTRSRLDVYLSVHPNWRTIYRDSVAVLFTRKK